MFLDLDQVWQGLLEKLLTDYCCTPCAHQNISMTLFYVIEIKKHFKDTVDDKTHKRTLLQ